MSDKAASRRPNRATVLSTRARTSSTLRTSRGDAEADLSRNHGAGVRRHRQDHHRYWRPVERGCRALSAAAKLAARTFGSTAAAGGRQLMKPSLVSGVYT